MSKANGISEYAKKLRKKKEKKIQSEQMGNYQSYFKFFSVVAVLKPVPEGLTFLEQANFLSFRHIYHKIQGWKEYEYRTVTWLECPFVPACRIGYIRQGCWLLLILYLCYFYNLKSELPSAELSIWCRTEALNSK